MDSGVKYIHEEPSSTLQGGMNLKDYVDVFVCSKRQGNMEDDAIINTNGHWGIDIFIKAEPQVELDLEVQTYGLPTSVRS